LEKFKAEKRVTGGKKANAFLIYARAGSCKESPYSIVWIERITIQKDSNYGHIYLTTLSDNIMVL
jgi:hypothetical protein